MVQIPWDFDLEILTVRTCHVGYQRTNCQPVCVRVLISVQIRPVICNDLLLIPTRQMFNTPSAHLLLHIRILRSIFANLASKLTLDLKSRFVTRFYICQFASRQNPNFIRCRPFKFKYTKKVKIVKIVKLVFLYFSQL